EPLGIRSSTHTTAFRLAHFDVGEDALRETLAVFLQHLLDAADVDRVVADADDHLGGDLGARFVHQAAHGAHAFLQPDEDRLADEEMADVQLHDLGNARNRLHGGVVEAVASVYLQPEAATIGGRVRDALALAFERVRARVERFAVGAGVQLHD